MHSRLDKLLIYKNSLFQFSSTNFSNKLVVFDRDDTIISDPFKNKDKSLLLWNNGALELMSEIQKIHKCWLAVISNQARIHDGSQKVANLEILTQQLFSDTFEKNISLSYVLYCPHSREQIASCGCRKPDVGMLRFLRDKLDIPQMNFVFIGNSETDAQAALNFDIKFIKYIDEFESIKSKIDLYFLNEID